MLRGICVEPENQLTFCFIIYKMKFVCVHAERLSDRKGCSKDTVYDKNKNLWCIGLEMTRFVHFD